MKWAIWNSPVPAMPKNWSGCLTAAPSSPPCERTTPPLLDRLRSRPDVFVWDLDLHQHPCQVGCVVMASGWSRRFSGENKLLLPVDGKPMIRHTLEKLAVLPLELPV